VQVVPDRVQARVVRVPVQAPGQGPERVLAPVRVPALVRARAPVQAPERVLLQGQVPAQRVPPPVQRPRVRQQPLSRP